MPTISEALALKDTAGLEAGVEALATHCPNPVPDGTVSQKLAAIAAQLGVTWVVGPSGDLRTPDQYPVDPTEAFHTLAAHLADGQALDVDDVEGGPSAHSEPEAPAPGSDPFTKGV